VWSHAAGSQAAVAAGRRIAHDGYVASRANERLVYSTGEGSVCRRCGWPAANCRCSSRGSEAPVPARVVAKLRVEKAGRGGKTVTVVYDLPRNAAFLKGLCQELKRACGSGGAVRDGAVEIQGDLRDRVRDVLLEKGFGVKG
jgi:translation initiation factor 1